MRNTYRSEIDGLRAIAVLGVLLFHFGVDRLGGGFAGVDVFFVISGFVITRLLRSELEAGTFSFATFYRRRIFRILPALLVTVALTTIAMFLFATPDRLTAYAPSALAAILSFSNIQFWNEAGYFDAGAETKPLLHTWSLGVEEQYYLIWPVLLVLLFGLRASAAARQRNILIGLGLLSLASLGAAIALLPTEASFVFYWMPFRIYEFAIGAALVFLPGVRSATRRCCSGSQRSSPPTTSTTT